MILFTNEDERMSLLKQKYYSFIQTLPDEYSNIKKPSLVTGSFIKNDLGSNVNKGGEIFICLDGETNDQFHILLHELAHSLVTEYDHSDGFWTNYNKLKTIAVNSGYYKPVETKNYCGDVISDS